MYIIAYYICSYIYHYINNALQVLIYLDHNTIIIVCKY